MIQSTACMRQFKAYTDLSGIFLIDWLAADNNKNASHSGHYDRYFLQEQKGP